MLSLACPHCADLEPDAPLALPGEGRWSRLLCHNCQTPWLAYCRVWIGPALPGPGLRYMAQPLRVLRIDEPGAARASPKARHQTVVHIRMHQGQLSFTLLSTTLPGSNQVLPFVIRKWVHDDEASTQIVEQHALIGSLDDLDCWIQSDPLTRLHAEAFVPLRDACRLLLSPPRPLEL